MFDTCTTINADKEVTDNNKCALNLGTKTHSQMAVLSSVDSKIVIFLSKTVPDMLTHTETKPPASLALKGSSNPTNDPVRDEVAHKLEQ